MAALALCGSCLAVACYEATTPEEPPPVGIRSPELQLPDTGTADGASLLPLSVVIDTATPSEKRNIALTTTAGVFAATSAVTATTTPDNAGIARSLLRAPLDSTDAIVTATVNGISVSRLVTYRRAMPDILDLDPGKFELQAGSTHELTLTAHLRRTVGKPSPNLRVTFTATDSTPARKSVGAFLPVIATSDASGIATTRFTIADTTQRGPIILRATAVGTTISGDAVVRVTAP